MRITDTLRDEIERHLGFFPPIFQAVQTTPALMEALWRQTLSCYVNNPLPALFKEKLLAYLARYCREPYWLIVHCCALRALGCDARQMLALLQRPAVRKSAIRETIASITAASLPHAAWPDRNSTLEDALFRCAVVVFLRRTGAVRCRNTLRAALDETTYNHLMALLSYAKTCHFLAESHPQFSCREDPRVQLHQPILQQESPELAALFHTHGRRMRPLRLKPLSGLAKRSYLPHAILLAPFPIMVYADDGRVLQINSAWTDLTGYTLRDIPTMADWFSKGQGDAAQWCREDISYLDDWDQRIDEGEYTITARDGSKRVCEFSSASLGRLPDGRRTVMRVAIDISDRKRLEQALWETNRKVINILECITDGLFALDDQWRFLYLNPKTEKIAQLDRERIIGRMFGEIFPQAERFQIVRALRQAAANRQTVHCRSAFAPGDSAFDFHIYPSAEGVTVYFR